MDANFVSRQGAALGRLAARLARALRLRRRSVTFFPDDHASVAGQCFRPTSAFELAAGWVVVQLKLPGAGGPVASSLGLDGEDDLPYPPLFLGAADKGRNFDGEPQFRYLPSRMRNLRLSVFGAAPAPPTVQLIAWELGPLSFLFISCCEFLECHWVGCCAAGVAA